MRTRLPLARRACAAGDQSFGLCGTYHLTHYFFKIWLFLRRAVRLHLASLPHVGLNPNPSPQRLLV